MSPSSDTSLRCPGCGSGMVEVESDTVLIDVCTSCNGLWLDKGELELLGGKLPPHKGVESANPHVCPRCQFPMDRRDARLATVDICWGCGGLFLDSAGFDSLVQASGGRKPTADDDATPVAGVPVFGEGSAAIDAPPEGAPALSPGEQHGTFWCELCRAPTPVAQRVDGERVSVCPACAARHDIQHDPKARQKAEREKASNNRRTNADEPLLSALLRILIPFI